MGRVRLGLVLLGLGAALASSAAVAETLVVTPSHVTEWKAVYGTVSPRTASCTVQPGMPESSVSS